MSALIFTRFLRHTLLLQPLLQLLLLSQQPCRAASPLLDGDALVASYTRPTDLTAELNRIVRAYPRLARLSSLGKSEEGRELWALRLTDFPDRDEPGEPQFKYVANMHGDEALGLQLLVNLAWHLLSSYERGDQRARRLLNGTDVYLVPTLNPDGYARATEGDCLGSDKARNNAHGVDINRDFPDQFLAEERAEETRAPETRAIMAWLRERNFVLSGNLHGGTMVASYPFDDAASGRDGYSASPDDAAFRWLARAYAGHNVGMRDGRPLCPGQEAESFPEGGAVNGAQWYSVSGGMQDYNYMWSNCFEVTFELSCCKFPPRSELPQFWELNRDPLITFIEQVHMGVKGFVRSLEPGSVPIPGASISVDGIAHPVTAWRYGDYHRLLVPGTYNLTASSPRFHPHTELNVAVREGITTFVDFLLQPLTPTHTEPPPNNTTTTHTTNTTLNATLNTTPPPPAFTTPPPPDFTTAPPPPPGSWRHHSYEEMERSLRTLSREFPRITRLYSAGLSAEGRQLHVIEISDNPGRHEAGEPEFRYVGNMHGNEVVGRELLLALSWHLCQSYGRHAALTRIVNTTRIHVMPCMNPDGYHVAMQEDVSGLVGRNNSRNVDLNRDFPDRLATQLGVGRTQLQPETVALMKWASQLPFVLSANLHGGSVVVNYPFDNSPLGAGAHYSATPDDETFRMLARSYAQKNPRMVTGNPCPELGFRDFFRNGITNGAAWYSVAGGMQDWVYLHTSAMEVTIELSCEKFPDASTLASYWESNQHSLINYMQQVCVYAYCALRLHAWILQTSNPEYLAVPLVYSPEYRHQVWRFLSYALMHSGLAHLAFNVSLQLLLGIPLEVAHGTVPVLALYLAGLVAGSLVSSVIDMSAPLVGASGGVYALLSAHLTNVVLHWSDVSCAGKPLCLAVAVLGMSAEVGRAVWCRFSAAVPPQPGFAAHVAGSLLGVSLGAATLRSPPRRHRHHHRCCPLAPCPRRCPRDADDTTGSTAGENDSIDGEDDDDDYDDDDDDFDDFDNDEEVDDDGGGAGGEGGGVAGHRRRAACPLVWWLALGPALAFVAFAALWNVFAYPLLGVAQPERGRDLLA